jgi:hypothetical protein
MKKILLNLIMLFLIFNASVFVNLSAQIPYVDSIENSGAGYAAPPFPIMDSLPGIGLFPDPFAWADKPLGSTRSTAFSDWKHHRAEIKAQIEHYEIGTKPAVDTSQIKASFANDTLTVVVTVGAKSLTLRCPVVLPAGTGPFPAVIGMNSPTGSLPVSAFTSRNIAQITYVINQVTVYSAAQNSDPFFQLYPDHNVSNTGQYCAWAWGVSRIIDGLYKLRDSLKIDLKHIAVTGCSYAGKMALFAGAFDERIALTVAQESGGGGATSWRASLIDPSGVEGLAQTNSMWFKDSMFLFGSNNVFKLPEDHHMLCAMVAPRALYFTGNKDYIWLSNPSCYYVGRAVQNIYDTLGIPDRFGFCVNGGHGHCAFPASQDPELAYFLDKFMLGDTAQHQIIETHPTEYDTLNYVKWYDWWGTGKKPALPVAFAGRSRYVTDTFNTGVPFVLDGSGCVDAGGTITSYVWTENNVQIATGKTQTVNLAVGVHNITLTITDEGGLTSSSVEKITVKAYVPKTGIAGKNNKDVYIYPNPVSKLLNLALDGSPSVLALYNSGGQQLLKLNTKDTKATIDMSKYLTGIYILKITTSDKSIIKKVMKQ